MKKLFNFRPIVFFGSSLALGVLCSVISSYVGFLAFVVPCCLLVAGFFIVAFSYEAKKYIPVGLIMAMAFSIGFASYYVNVDNSQKAVRLGEKSIYFSGTVESINVVADGKYSVVISNVSAGNAQLGGSNLSLYTDNSLVSVGDTVEGSAKFAPRVIDFGDRYALSNKSFYKAEGTVYLKIVAKDGSFARYFGRQLERAIVDNVDMKDAGIPVAILLGRTTYMKDADVSNFRAAGVAHVFAVSGLHVGFVFALFFFLFSLLPLKRAQKVTLSLLVALFYALMCGTPSSYRAVITCAVLGFGGVMGKKYDLLNSTFIAMSIILLFSPESLFSVGFILSFSAVISLALWSKQFQRAFLHLPKKLAAALAASLSVVVGTLPALLAFFGYASVITVFINLIILPIVPVIYVTSLFGSLAALTVGANFILDAAVAVSRAVGDLISIVDLGRFIITFRGDAFILSVYVSSLLLTTERLNIPKPIRKFFYILTPAAAILTV